MTTHGHIYFVVYNNEAIKIGFSVNPGSRWYSLRTACPVPLQLIGSIPGTNDEEKMIHKKFAHFRFWGEWFRVADDLLDFIEGFEKDGTLIDPQLLIDQSRVGRTERRKNQVLRGEA